MSPVCMISLMSFELAIETAAFLPPCPELRNTFGLCLSAPTIGRSSGEHVRKKVRKFECESASLLSKTLQARLTRFLTLRWSKL